MNRLKLLQYAKGGIIVDIGTHPCPGDYPEEIEGLEKDLAWVEKQIEKRKKWEAEKNDLRKTCNFPAVIEARNAAEGALHFYTNMMKEQTTHDE